MLGENMNKPLWNIELIKRGDLRTDMAPVNVEPTARKIIADASNNQLLILSTFNNSPEKIMRAAPYSQENLAAMIKYNEEKQAESH